MPKQAMNPRRFSREEIDPSEPLTTHVALRPQRGTEDTCANRLRAVLRRHPGAVVSISGVSVEGRQAVITLAVHLGGAESASADLAACQADPAMDSQGANGVRLVKDVLMSLYDFSPKLVLAPPPEAAARGREYGRAILGAVAPRSAARPARPARVARPALALAGTAA